MLSSLNSGSATTCLPLTVSLSLSSATPTIESSGDESFEPTDHVDIFDWFDAQSTSIATSNDLRNDHVQPSPSKLTVESQRALADSTAVFYPSIYEEYLQSGSETPSWFADASARVTAITATRIPRSSLETRSDEATTVHDNASNSDVDVALARTDLRVAVGCRDGTLWLFASPCRDSTATDLAQTPARPTRSSRVASSDSLYPNSPSNGLALTNQPPTPLSSPPTSPPLGQSGQKYAQLSRPATLVHRQSAASLSTHRSFASGSRSSPEGARPISRPRKANATVSMSAPLSITNPSTPASQSRPMTPSIPHDTPPSPSLTAGSTNFNVLPPSPSVSRQSKRSHRKAKDSIATGIGLWETESHHAAGQAGHVDTDRDDTLDHDPSMVDLAADTNAALDSLHPLIRIRLAGSGAIVGLQIAEGLRHAREEKQAMVVLRKNGLLSLLSLVDGTCLATCDVAASSVSDTSPPGLATFDGLRILQVADTNLAICYSCNGTGFTAVDLDFMTVQGTSTQPGPMSEPVAIFKQGIHFLVFAVGDSDSDNQEPEIMVRPVYLQQIANGRPHPPVLPASDQADHTTSHLNESPMMVRIEPAHSAGRLKGLQGVVKGLRHCADDLIAFSESMTALVSIRDQQASVIARITLDGIVDVCVTSYSSVLLVTKSHCHLYRLEPTEAISAKEDYLFRFVPINQCATGTIEMTASLPASPSISGAGVDFLLVQSDPASRGLALLESKFPRSGPVPSASQLDLRLLYRAEHSAYSSRRPRITAAARYSRNSVIVGFSSGHLTRMAFHELTSDLQSRRVPSFARLSGSIALLEVVHLGGRAVLIVGTVHGVAGAWDLSNWTELGRWNLFASSVQSVEACGLRDVSDGVSACTLVFVSANSPVALVTLTLGSSSESTVDLILPGTRSSVESVSIHSEREEILVVYQQGLARICHRGSGELRRSMDYRTAQQVLSEPAWETHFSLAGKRASPQVASTIASSSISFNIRQDVDETVGQLPWSVEGKRRNKPGAAIRQKSLAVGPNRLQSLDDRGLGLVRSLLARLVPADVDVAVDDLLRDHLEVPLNSEGGVCAAIDSPGASAFPSFDHPVDAWTMSPRATAQRLLQIVCLLRIFLNYPDTERYAGQAIVHFASSLQDAVGPRFQFPSLEFFAEFWLDESAEIQQAARSLFGTYLGACSDVEVVDLVAKWQDLLPSRQPEGSLVFDSADRALLLIGLIAADKFKLLPASVLKDISESIVLYLDDAAPQFHQAIAAELCSRAFETWQHYVDAALVVRQLFGLATGRNPATASELRGLARQATVHIAGVNTPLFMTTLLNDILHAPTAAHRNATLKLLGFMVRKRPLVLHTSLPRIAEAIVKSLDPTVTDLRQTVHQAATVILDELVRTFPSIDFEHKSQRLAVGTQEGSSIIYDLKTATRMYVLEGHRQSVTALSWSPDGHRLISVCLDESKVVVWKVGLGILSMFMPGAPPRQGGGKDAGPGAPFKTYDFHVGDEAMMTTAATLEWVVFDWPADRTARLRLRETALNFGC